MSREHKALRAFALEMIRDGAAIILTVAAAYAYVVFNNL